MNNICLFGASGHGKVIKDIILSNNKEVVVFLDDKPTAKTLLNTPVLSSKMLHKYSKTDFIISVGDNMLRKKISERLEVNFATEIHKFASIAASVSFKEGTVVMSGVSINADSRVGKHCIINTNAVIEHDCHIEDYVHISPNATITGNVTIGEGTHIGANAVIIPNIKIGKWVTVGAGAVVINDIPDYRIAVGNPARITNKT